MANVGRQPSGWRRTPRPDHAQRYGTAHRAERASRMAQLRAHPGSLFCPRCGRPVHADEQLDLDHDDRDPTGGTYLPGLAHRRCNERAASARGHYLRHGARRTPQRQPQAAQRPDLPVW